MVDHCGALQVPLAGRRRSLGAAVTRTENFRQKTVERFTNYHRDAENHMAGRNDGVARLLLWLSLLRNLGDIRANAAVQWDRAHVQTIRGARTTPAAHHLPCQVLIDSRLPWQCIASPELNAAALQSALEKLFADVWVLPLAFNLADSLAESHCLRGSLVAACQEAIARTKPVRTGALNRGGEIELRHGWPRQEPAGFDHDAVSFAYDLWRERSVASYQAAHLEATAQGVVYAGEDFTGDVAYILGQYIHFAGVPPAALLRDVAGRARMEMWA